jgi:hypothetical protein
LLLEAFEAEDADIELMLGAARSIILSEVDQPLGSSTFVIQTSIYTLIHNPCVHRLSQLFVEVQSEFCSRGLSNVKAGCQVLCCTAFVPRLV